MHAESYVARAVRYSLWMHAMERVSCAINQLITHVTRSGAAPQCLTSAYSYINENVEEVYS